MADPFVGKLAFFRVYSGTMNSGSYVLNATKNKKERVGRILLMHANKREDLEKVYTGTSSPFSSIPLISGISVGAGIYSITASNNF